MKVKHLIEILQEYDPELNVWVQMKGGGLSTLIRIFEGYGGPVLAGETSADPVDLDKPLRGKPK